LRRKKPESPDYHPGFECCEKTAEAIRHDLVIFADQLLNEGREIEAIGVLKIAILWLESSHKIS
jgi:hypothetical protein